MKTLIIAPHPDDELIGVGGTIAKKANEGQDVYVCVITKGVEPLFSEELVRQTREECREADKYLGVKETIFLDHPAVMLENVPRYELNNSILDVIKTLKPDEVFIPHRGDMQQDHKIVVDASMVALRPKYEHVVKKIYSYETLSETGWDIPNTVNEFIPNVFVNISNYLTNKLNALSMFETQMSFYPNARSLEAVKALAMFRGATMNLRAAEAFQLIRQIKL